LTTLVDRALQLHLEATASEFARWADLASIAMIVVRNRDMAVRAYVGGGNYFDAERAGMLDLVRTQRSPGSALKPVIYGLAFEDLIVHPNTIVMDDAIRFPGYAPENFDKRYQGEMLVRDALIQSINTVAVMLLKLVGPDRFVSRLKAAGIAINLPEPRTAPGLAIALGGLGINLENLAKVFAGIANGGTIRALRYLAGDPADPGVPFMAPEAAWAVTDILADMPSGQGRVALRARDGQRRVAYKTGTSYGFKDAWAVGFDATHTVAVWVGRPDAIGRPGETGASTAVPIMQKIFDLLPVPEHDVAADRPVKSVLARTSELPERLRRHSPLNSSSGHHAVNGSFEIRFPLNGSTIRLPHDRKLMRRMVLWVTGGRPPFRWYIDGRSVAGETSDNRISWSPEGRGQIEIVVIDASGAKTTSTAWLD
jgi:penicillin-binding protein 1C